MSSRRIVASGAELVSRVPHTRWPVDLHLAQTFLGDFDGVVGGPDLCVGAVQMAEHRVQRRRLAGAGRAADKE